MSVMGNGVKVDLTKVLALSILSPHLTIKDEDTKMAIFLEYEGIKGNVTADGYEDHIAVLSVDFNVTRSISMEPGNLSNRESTRPRLSQVTISKVADSSCSALFKESVTGSAGKTVVIKYVRTGSDKVVEFLEHTLENCIISRYDFSAGAEGQPIEVIDLSFSKMLVNYTDHDATNKSGSPLRVGYDLKTAKPL